MLLATLLMFATPGAFAAPQFPALTGRVVDEAGILSPRFESEISAQLAAHERATTNQVVVVTLKSLQGYDISDYGYQLGRRWGIGQKAKNNGVLLIVAPSERKLRIEVGYGLEGVLTDAISRDIIERRLKPAFRQQNYEQGVRDGASAILAALGGEYRTAPPPVTVGEGPGWSFFVPFALPLVVFFAFAAAQRFGERRPRGTRLAFGAAVGVVFGVMAWIVFASLVVGLVIGLLVFVLTSSAQTGSGSRGSGGAWSSGGGSGGGFSGGGSFGGGGASGDW